MSSSLSRKWLSLLSSSSSSDSPKTFWTGGPSRATERTNSSSSSRSRAARASSTVNVARLLMLSKNHRLTSKSKLFSNFRAKSASTILQSKIDFSQATETQPSLDGFPSNKKHKKAEELSCAMVRAIEHYVTYL
eukprot:scpid38441/ scgid30824/ 